MLKVFGTCCAALALMGAATAASAGTIVSGFDSNTLAANDDESTGLVNLGFNFNFYGTTYSQTYVNNNGNVTFDQPQSTFTPYGLTTTLTPIIAPFFADIDTRGAGSSLTTYGTGTYGGQNAFGVNWVDVGYYEYHTDKLNSIQLIIVDRSDIASGDADIYFNYDQILWETGDASHGQGGFGGDCAAAGYSNGTGAAGTNFEIAGSHVCGAFLDSGPDALIAATNDGTPGQFLFQVRGGTVIQPPPSNGVPEPASVLLFGAGLAGFAARRRRA